MIHEARSSREATPPPDLRCRSGAVLAIAAGEVDGLVVRLLAYTGLRWVELAALTVGSVDMLRHRLQITHAVAEADGRREWKSRKDHERRLVPFPAFLTDELSKQMVGKGREDLLFSASKGGPLRVSHRRPRVFNAGRDSRKDFPKVPRRVGRRQCPGAGEDAGP